VLTDPLDLTEQPCSSLVVDGGWLLYMVKWEQGHTWQEIADSYLNYVQYLGRHSQKITMVVDGYSHSPKDHDHIRHTKNSCCNAQIQPNMMHLTPKAKFLDNTHNENEIIHLLSSAFQKHQITVEQDEWSSHPSRSNPASGLDGETQPEGCLPTIPNSPRL